MFSIFSGNFMCEDFVLSSNMIVNQKKSFKNQTTLNRYQIDVCFHSIKLIIHYKSFNVLW